MVSAPVRYGERDGGGLDQGHVIKGGESRADLGYVWEIKLTGSRNESSVGWGESGRGQECSHPGFGLE